MKVSVTGHLNTIKICFAELLESALERYHSRQRKTNFIDAEEKRIISAMSPRRLLMGDKAINE
jgi:hypothetical protein